MPNNRPVGVAYSDPALTAFYLNAPVTKTASFTLGDSENFVIANGGKVMSLQFVDGKSTTKLIEKAEK